MALKIVFVPKDTVLVPITEPEYYTKWREARERKEHDTFRSRLQRTSKSLFPHLHHNGSDRRLPASSSTRRRPRPAMELPNDSNHHMNAIIPDSRFPDKIYEKHETNVKKTQWEAEAKNDRLGKARNRAGVRKPDQPSRAARGKRVPPSTEQVEAWKAGKGMIAIPIEPVPAPGRNTLKRLSRHGKAWSAAHLRKTSHTSHSKAEDKAKASGRPPLKKNPRWTEAFRAFPYRFSFQPPEKPGTQRKSFRKSMIKRATSVRWNRPVSPVETLAAKPFHFKPTPINPARDKSAQATNHPPQLPSRSPLRDYRFPASCVDLPSPTLPNVARKTTSTGTLHPPYNFSEEGVGLGVSYGGANRGIWSPGKRITIAKQREHSRVLTSRLQELADDGEKEGYFAGAELGEPTACAEMSASGARKHVRRSRSVGELARKGLEQTASKQGPSSDAGKVTEMRGRSESSAKVSTASERSEGPRRHVKRPSQSRGVRLRGQAAETAPSQIVNAPDTKDHPLRRDLAGVEQIADRSTLKPEATAAPVVENARRCSSVYSVQADDGSEAPVNIEDHKRNTVRFADPLAVRRSKRKSRSAQNLSISDFLNEIENDQRVCGDIAHPATKNEQNPKGARAADLLAGRRSKRKSTSLQNLRVEAYQDDVGQGHKVPEGCDHDLRALELKNPARAEMIKRALDRQQQRIHEQRGERSAHASDEASDIIQPMKVFTSSQPLRIPPPGSLVVATKKPGVDTRVHPALRDEKPLPEPIPQNPVTVEVTALPPSLAHHLLRSTVPTTGRRPSKSSRQASEDTSSRDKRVRDSRLQHTPVSRTDRTAIVAVLNRARDEVVAPRLRIEAKLDLRAQTYADLELPPLTPAKEDNPGRAKYSPSHQVTVIQPAAPFSPGLMSVKTTRLISPPDLSAYACAELWALGRMKRHKVISTTLSPSTHRYTKFRGAGMAGRVSALIGASPPTPESEGDMEGVQECKSGSCDCKEYDAWATVTDVRWKGMGVGRAEDGRWIVELIEIPGPVEGGRI